MSVIIWSVLVGVGIALHIFVVMMETGATQGGLRKKKIFALGAIFLGVQICMQTCGILLTWWIKQYLHIAALERIYKTVYVILLIWIGYKLFARLRKTDFPDERKSSPLSLKQCAALSFRDQRGSPAPRHDHVLLQFHPVFLLGGVLRFPRCCGWFLLRLLERGPQRKSPLLHRRSSPALSGVPGRFSFKKKIPGK